MYASVRRYEGVTDPPEAGRRTAEGFVPLIKDVPGLVAYHFADAGGGVMISISVYEDQSGAEESNQREGAWDAENLAELMPNPPEISPVGPTSTTSRLSTVKPGSPGFPTSAQRPSGKRLCRTGNPNSLLSARSRS